jgi:iron-sulfur cluster insertion protein
MQVESFNPVSDLVTVTQAAQQHFKLQTEGADALGIKLSLTGGGCAGFMYDWKLIENIGDINLTDWSKEYTGWTFYLDSMSKQYLAGSTIELVTGIAGQHIEIQAPLAESACGCGESVTFSL